MVLSNKPTLLSTPAESGQATSYTRTHRNQLTNSLTALHLQHPSWLVTNTEGIVSLDIDTYSTCFFEIDIRYSEANVMPFWYHLMLYLTYFLKKTCKKVFKSIYASRNISVP